MAAERAHKEIKVDDCVRMSRRARAVVLTLDRPKGRNALTLGMVRSLQVALDHAVADAGVERIVVRSAAPGTFSAGGDIRAVRELVLAGCLEVAMKFFKEEFSLNHAIASCPKPIVALVDGVCMPLRF
jgi:Enoyl-CoA hydratase/carnithine racemase